MCQTFKSCQGQVKHGNFLFSSLWCTRWMFKSFYYSLLLNNILKEYLYIHLWHLMVMPLPSLYCGVLIVEKIWICWILTVVTLNCIYCDFSTLLFNAAVMYPNQCRNCRVFAEGFCTIVHGDRVLWLLSLQASVYCKKQLPYILSVSTMLPVMNYRTKISSLCHEWKLMAVWKGPQHSTTLSILSWKMVSSSIYGNVGQLLNLQLLIITHRK